MVLQYLTLVLILYTGSASGFGIDPQDDDFKLPHAGDSPEDIRTLQTLTSYAAQTICEQTEELAKYIEDNLETLKAKTEKEVKDDLCNECLPDTATIMEKKACEKGMTNEVALQELTSYAAQTLCEQTEELEKYIEDNLRNLIAKNEKEVKDDLCNECLPDTATIMEKKACEKGMTNEVALQELTSYAAQTLCEQTEELEKYIEDNLRNLIAKNEKEVKDDLCNECLPDTATITEKKACKKGMTKEVFCQSNIRDPGCKPEISKEDRQETLKLEELRAQTACQGTNLHKYIEDNLKILKAKTDKDKKADLCKECLPDDASDRVKRACTMGINRKEYQQLQGDKEGTACEQTEELASYFEDNLQTLNEKTTEDVKEDLCNECLADTATVTEKKACTMGMTKEEFCLSNIKDSGCGEVVNEKIGNYQQKQKKRRSAKEEATNVLKDCLETETDKECIECIDEAIQVFVELCGEDRDCSEKENANTKNSMDRFNIEAIEKNCPDSSIASKFDDIVKEAKDKRQNEAFSEKFKACDSNTATITLRQQCQETEYVNVYGKTPSSTEVHAKMEEIKADDAYKATQSCNSTSECLDAVKGASSENITNAKAHERIRSGLRKEVGNQMRICEVSNNSNCLEMQLESVNENPLSKKVSILDLGVLLHEDAILKVTNTMRACKEANSCADCKGTQVKDALENTLARDVEDCEVDEFLKKGAADVATKTMRTCRETAGNEDEKNACKDLVKTTVQDALCLDSVPSDRHLKELLRYGAKYRVGNAMQACVEAAETIADKEACLKGNDVKVALAESLGIDVSEVSDTVVAKFVHDAAKDIAVSAMQTCAESANGDEAKLEKCAEDLESTLAAALGNDLSTEDVRDFINDGAKRDIADAMQACTLAQNATSTNFDNIKERLAKIQGKKADQIDEAKVFEFIKDGAKDRIKNSVQVCIEEAQDAAAKRN
eukprot:g1583.t1